jgi:BirA family biotin operon repressor/biotin-[acetyl-CoA-carboxylase] ligase
VDVKWPNDLHLAGRKFAGILPESALLDNALAWVVVGIGINVNQHFAANDPLVLTATSIREMCGTAISRTDLLAGILTRLNAWYALLHDRLLAQTWRARCGTLGQRVRVESNDVVVEGLAEDIDPSGALWLRDARGQRHLLTVGEATLLPPF